MSTILIIEDEEGIRENIYELLSAEDFEVLLAENGKTGIQLAQQQRPDLIICDIMMPEVDGYGVLNQLRQNLSTEAIPFIFLTAKSAKADLRQGMESGADDYLSKPFTREALLRAIAARFEKQGVLERQSQKKLDELRGQICHSLPHELYTPLNGIIASSSFFINEYDDIDRDEALEILQDIHTSSQRLYRLTKNFLLYAELELMANDPARLQALQSREVKSESQPLIFDVVHQKAKQVNREADLELNLQGTKIYMSEANLRKLIEEIVDNAFKFSPPGTAVSICDRVETNRVILTITDHGRGMTSEQIANLGAYMQFERKLYEQQGSGLGLAIAQCLAQLHGGDLTVKSSPGKETTVRVSLTGE